ncbi:hypothetical protein [Streptomyces mutomycini]|uniref:hypothetical protein n=1 Tax=Streptomyces mutomycini TaxID=284036 RepID=UPI0033DAE11D
MSAREELLEALLPLYRAQYAPGEEESSNALIDAFAHELAEEIRRAQFGPEGQTWNWWDAATIPDECANLIDPEVEK